MFNRDFYPTPKSVIDLMLSQVDLIGKVVLEPSAGSGKLIDYALQFGAKGVLCCEINEDLARICGSKGRLIARDFLTVRSEQVSHIDLIIMNPPFSAEEDHINHAWNIAPGGCQIVSLCNWQMYSNSFTRKRTELKNLILQNGSIENLGDVFTDAERSTDIEIGLVRLFKPKFGEDEFDGYLFDMNEEQDEPVNLTGVMKHNEIREIVNRYVGAVKMFDSVMEANKTINNLIQPISKGLGIGFGAYQTYTSRGVQTKDINRESFKKELQKSAWASVFDKMNMQKYVTTGVMSDINKFVEQQQQVPFTMGNVFRMLEIIIGTHSGRMDMVLVEVFDRICELSADNSEAGEKWKTNSNYKVNRRFISNWVCEYDNRWPTNHVKIRVGHRETLIDDTVKALCFITGKSYDQVMLMEYTNNWGSKERCHKSLYSFFNYNHTPWGEWVQWNEFFRVRGYKKGTMHFEFVSEDVWMEFNIRVAKIKGWQLPKKTDNKRKGTERTRQTGVELFETV
jgi:hypothetical protein